MESDYFATPKNEANMIRQYLLLGVLGLLYAGCGGGGSLDPAQLEGKSQAWFEENWGKPSARVSRFFGGEQWVYSRISGGGIRLPFFHSSPNQCPITLEFNKEQSLEAYDFLDC